MTEQEIIQKFKISRKKWGMVILITAFLIFVGFALQSLTGEFGPIAITGVMAFFVFNIGSYIVYRCPKCNAVPLEAEGFSIFPSTCRKCGSKLSGK